MYQTVFLIGNKRYIYVEDGSIRYKGVSLLKEDRAPFVFVKELMT